MKRLLRYTEEAEEKLNELRNNPAKASLFKQTLKTLGLLETNLRHPSLNTHVYESLHGPHGEKVFEACIQQQTPGAYRIFFCYGPDIIRKDKREPVLTILAIVAHPEDR